ncbi:Hcp family type VI secretion system effector [Pseudoduganella plicata]|uniref:Protein hcp1 n=1 Tax=Pseudoduganella plicata TaxID=321984 RepID=A0A4P7BAB8_9BURK|nr:type VI secretion system tube protein Hcp [Pseudoduganella plicata]QBQ35040.1 type VI secretion system tube protein Hcp [Pseudoduganella plicata]GGZ07011.1 protein hcp1 [Pseudoduganella plicata]
MAVDMFLNLGKTIAGETQDSAQKAAGDIDVLAWSWGASNAGSFHAGGGGGAGKANFQDISITKYLDKSSPAILIALAKGSHIPTATLLVRKAGEGQQKYLEVTMNKVLITSVSTGGSGGEDRLTENVTLNFAEMKFEYFLQNEKGVTASGGVFDWDIAGNVSK